MKLVLNCTSPLGIKDQTVSLSVTYEGEAAHAVAERQCVLIVAEHFDRWYCDYVSEPIASEQRLKQWKRIGYITTEQNDFIAVESSAAAMPAHAVPWP